MEQALTFKTRNFWVWPGPQQAGDAGERLLSDAYLHFIVYRIDGFPRLALNRDLAHMEVAQRVAVFNEVQQKFLDSMYKLCPVGDREGGHVGLSWRYLLDPAAPFEHKLSLYLIVRTCSAGPEDPHIAHIAQLIPYVFPTDRGLYHPPRRVLDPRELKTVLHGAHGYTFVGEVRKKEMQFRPLVPIPDLRTIYIPLLFSPQPNTMISVCETLVKQRDPVVLDINLVPTALTEYEIEVLKKAVVNYDKLKRDQKIQIPVSGEAGAASGFVDAPADPIVQLAFDTFRSSLNAYATGSLFLMSCRVLSNSAATVEAVLVTMARSASREYDYELLNMSGENKEEFGLATVAYQHCNVSCRTRANAIWDAADAPLPFRRLHRLVGSAEANAFFRLPIPSEEGVPGLPSLSSSERAQSHAATRAGKSEPSLAVGRIMLRGTPLDEDVSIPLRQLSKHALIVGVPGSGKTTAVLNLLHQLWVNHKVPFLVLELAKTEYRNLLRVTGMEDLLVFTLGSDVSPFIFNPMAVLPDIRLERHFSAIEECFRGAMKGLEGPIPFILREALEKTYRDRGWGMADLGRQHSIEDTPTLADLKMAIEQILPTKGYQGELAGNIHAALALRMHFLTNRHLSVGRMLNNVGSVSVQDLFQRPVILEMDALNEETKALMAMFILNLLREQAMSTASSQGAAADGPLRHVIVLEEAHNLLGHIPLGANHETDPKAQAVKYFVRLLAEMRALREGIIVADQLPSALAMEVIKNTNVKIMHRLTSEDDRQILGATMVLTAEQFVRAVTLNPGQSFLFQEGWEQPYQVLGIDVKRRFREEGTDVEDLVSDVDLATTMKTRWDADSVPVEYDPVLSRLSDPLIREAYARANELSKTDECALAANRVLGNRFKPSEPPRSALSATLSNVSPFRETLDHGCACAGLLDALAEDVEPVDLSAASAALPIGLHLFRTSYLGHLRVRSQVPCRCDSDCRATAIGAFIGSSGESV
jgi:hypothetical protein